MPCSRTRHGLTRVGLEPPTSGSGVRASVGEERANFSAIVYLQLCGFCSERFPFPLGVCDGLHYFIVALSEPSI